MNYNEIFKHKPGEVRQISSVSNDLVKAMRSLRLKKNRDDSGFFIAEGARTLIEALELSKTPLAIACLASARDDEALNFIRNKVAEKGGLILEVSEAVLDKISARDNPQTVIGLFEQDWKQLVALTPETSQILVLEQVRDPGNLGTIIRTCDGFGVTHIILLGETTDPFGLEAVRASMGSIFAVHIYRASFKEFEHWLGAYKGEVIGTSLEGAGDITDANFKTPHVLIMGNEQKGMSAALKSHCTQLVKIPMQGRADSFNLAVATGITLYCARKV